MKKKRPKIGKDPLRGQKVKKANKKSPLVALGRVAPNTSSKWSRLKWKPTNRNEAHFSCLSPLFASPCNFVLIKVDPFFF
jgi:hypothetical protein